MAAQPQQFGKYQLVEELGIGAMARVYRAVRSGPMGFHKEVAIKQLLPQAAEGDKAVRALVNEARLGGFLHHRNIVEVYEFDRVDETYYIAMEYVRGYSLDQVLKRATPEQPLPPRVVAQIVIQICAGLSYAHDAVDKDGKPMNLVHRDLKPANVMLTSDGVVKIMDFGIARATTNLYLTQASGTTKGTPGYMSPEQTMSGTSDQLDRRSDLFSLGSLMAEMITGRRSFASENLYDILRRIARADVGEILDLVGRQVPSMEPIVRRAFARDRDLRYQTADEFARDVRAIHDDLPGDERLGSWIDPWMGREIPGGATRDDGGLEQFAAMQMEPPSMELDPPTTDQEVDGSRRGAWWLVAVVGGAAVLALCAVAVAVVVMVVLPSGTSSLDGTGAGGAPDVAGDAVLDAASSGGDTEGHGDVAADPEIEALDDAGEDAAASRATAAAADVTEQATDAPAMILTSSPSGATVALDGRRLGRTPYRYDGGVGGRQYRVSYTLEGYEETSVGGVFPGEGTVTVRATLQPVAEPATDGDLPDVSAAVSPATVDAIVGSNAAVRRCVTQATDRGDALPARVWIKFTVHDDGHISGTYTLSPELSGSETERCLAQQVNGLRFGPFTGAQTKTVKFYLDAP